jgi:hypothetical protein
VGKSGESRSTLAPELHACGIVVLAPWTLHPEASPAVGSRERSDRWRKLTSGHLKVNDVHLFTICEKARAARRRQWREVLFDNDGMC